MRVVFIGTGEIGVPALQWLRRGSGHEVIAVVTQPDKPAGRHQALTPSPIKAALGDEAIPLLQPARIKHAEAVAEIRALAPELIVVMAYGQILPRSVLEIPTRACLNLHASLLPKYRGAAPIQAAILAGEAETGITVMYMDEGLDTGDILLQSRLELSPNETGGSLHDRLGELAPVALAKALTLLENGRAPRLPQAAAAATYAPKLEREHGRIDWHQDARAIERKIRAFHPWPGTFTTLRDAEGREKKLKILSAAVAPDSLPPGQIEIASHQIVIGAQGGALRLGEIQLEGKKRMTGEEFTRGHPWLAQATLA